MKKIVAVLVILGLVLVGLSFSSPPARKASAEDATGPVILGSAWNVGALASGASIFSSNLVPKNAGSMIRITIVISPAGGSANAAMGVKETDGTTTFTSLLNTGNVLNEGVIYGFNYEVRCATAIGGAATSPKSFNIVTAGPTTIALCRVTELAGTVTY